LLARTGQLKEALALRPGYAAWEADLAWLLATAADARRRDPAEALRLTEAACQRGGAHSLEALAAAQAAVAAGDEELAARRQASALL
jgi:hypothetical protein